MKMKFLAAAMIAVVAGGCSTIIEGRHQDIAINTNPAGANCVIKRQNDNIAQVNNTPATVNIEKTKYDILIVCDKPGYQEGTYLNHSGADIATVGNIVLGGGIGWAVDSATGSDNKYDSSVNMTLLPVQPAPSTGTSAPAPSAPGKPSS